MTSDEGPRRRDRFLIAVAGLASTTLLAGIVVRLTVRDAVLLTAALFYATPPVVSGVLAFLAAGFWLWAGRRKWAALLGIVGLACGLWWWQADWVSNPPTEGFPPAPVPADREGRLPVPATGIRVLCWNCRHGTAGWDRIARRIAQEKPALIALVEADDDNEDRSRALRRHLPGYDVAVASGAIVLLADGEILGSRSIPIAQRSRLGVFQVRLEAGDLTAMVVDVASSPLLSRRKPLAALGELTDRWSARPLIVMGDFNTPPDSLFFDDWRPRMRNAFEAAGAGPPATWPVPVPVLTLDHVWVNRHLRVRGCRLGFSRLSDHRPVIAEVTVGGMANDE